MCVEHSCVKRKRNFLYIYIIPGNSYRYKAVANMIGPLLKVFFLVHHSPIFEAWKVPYRPVEVLCDVVPD